MKSLTYCDCVYLKYKAWQYVSILHVLLGEKVIIKNTLHMVFGDFAEMAVSLCQPEC